MVPALIIINLCNIVKIVTTTTNPYSKNFTLDIITILKNF